MRRELCERLKEAFPLLYRKMYSQDPRDGNPINTGIECGDGWFTIIWMLSSKLEPLIEMQREPWGGTELRGSSRQILHARLAAAAQVKVKFGRLCFYTDGNTTDEMMEHIGYAMAHARWTCHTCGRPKRQVGVEVQAQVTYCDICAGRL